MHRADGRRRRAPRLGSRAAAAGCAVLLGLLPGCSSDEPAKKTAAPLTAPVARAPRGTTDSGSRLVDFSAPLGALTVETPPVRVRRR